MNIEQAKAAKADLDKPHRRTAEESFLTKLALLSSMSTLSVCSSWVHQSSYVVTTDVRALLGGKDFSH
jgi:hypothetical protein